MKVLFISWSVLYHLSDRISDRIKSVKYLTEILYDFEDIKVVILSNGNRDLENIKSVLTLFKFEHSEKIEMVLDESLDSVETYVKVVKPNNFLVLSNSDIWRQHKDFTKCLFMPRLDYKAYCDIGDKFKEED